MTRFLLLAALMLSAPTASAQALADTLFTWQGYGRTSTCHLAIFESPDEDRPHAIVVRETGDNAGDSTLDDARYLVEQIGRTYGIDPAEATWVFHWGAFSYAGAEGRKEILLRATFRRGKRGTLTTPSWRVVSRAEVDELTDRQYR